MDRFSTLCIGTFLVIIGKNGAKFFSFILSPIKNFLRSIGVKATIPIIAGILVIPIGLAAIEYLEQYAEKRRLERHRERYEKQKRIREQERIKNR